MGVKGNNPALWETIRGLCLDPSAPEYDVVKVSDALVEVIREIGDHVLADRVADGVAEGLFTVKEGSLLIGVASYSTDDDGARIRHVLEAWLEANEDERRMEMALDQDVVPFRSGERRGAALKAIGDRFPQLAERCERLLKMYPGDY